jgi:hypothetical protein
MEHIILTEFGEALNPYSGSDKHGTTERTALFSSCVGEVLCGKDMVGTHDICNGTIQLRKVSTTHNALCCSYCNLRILIPKEIDDYKKLRHWFRTK